MTYPEELLYLFPYLKYQPEAISTHFLNSDSVKDLVLAINHARRQTMTVRYTFGIFTSQLSRKQTEDIFYRFALKEQASSMYRWALIQHRIPDGFRGNELNDEMLTLLLNAYTELDRLESQYAESLGISKIGFAEVDDTKTKIEAVRTEIKKARRQVCLSFSTHIIQTMEIDRLCEQYPFLNNIKPSLYLCPIEQVQEKISEFLFERFLLLSPFYSTDTEPGERFEDLINALVTDMLEDDMEGYCQHAQNYTQFIDTFITQKLSDYSYDSEAHFDTEFIHNLFVRLTNRALSQMDRIAEAYLFLQYAGFGSESDLYFTDIYTAYRHSHHIANYKKVFLNLLLPFYPLLQEYEAIGLYEKNSIIKVVRALIPLMIVAATIVIISAVLAPLGLPEIAFIAAFIPSLIIGLGLASFYCRFNQVFYQFCREVYYGGQYQLPEFQVNERMTIIFSELAPHLCQYYVNKIKSCQALEKELSIKASLGTMTDQEKNEKIKNYEYLHVLLSNWRDIHENTELTCDEVVEIVKKQLTYELRNLKKKQVSEIDLNRLTEINQWKTFAEKLTNVHCTETSSSEYTSKLSLFSRRKEKIDRFEQTFESLASSCVAGIT